MAEEANCRHEYVIIYQRRLKGLDRRLVGTRAYLPVGFNMNDFRHLSEGSFCFCTKCRKRLFPRKSKAEKLEERLERKRKKEEDLAKMREELLASGEDELDKLDDSGSGMPFGLGGPKKTAKIFDEDIEEDEDVDNDDDIDADDTDDLDDDDSDDEDDLNKNLSDSDDVDEDSPDIDVDEMEVESVDVVDIKAEGVKFSSDDDLDSTCDLDEEEIS